jgi:hypothetical protein
MRQGELRGPKSIRTASSNFYQPHVVASGYRRRFAQINKDVSNIMKSRLVCSKPNRYIIVPMGMNLFLSRTDGEH